MSAADEAPPEVDTPAQEPDEAESPPEPPPTTTADVDDANDLRGYHFGRLLRSPLTWVLIEAVALLGGVIGLLTAGPILGLIVFAALNLIGIYVTFQIADSRAADDFFEAYASQRGMTVFGRTDVPAATPLLRRGDERYAERSVEGTLGQGVDGALIMYTYVVETSDSDGNRDKNYHRFTLAMTDVPECTERLPELYCQRKSGLRSLEKLEDVFRTSKERVTLESEALAERYEIFSRKGQDANFLRQVFSPTFIVWLTESAPEHFAFELVDGALVTYVNGHKEDTAHLDGMAAAASAVATRLREESTE